MSLSRPCWVRSNTRFWSRWSLLATLVSNPLSQSDFLSSVVLVPTGGTQANMFQIQSRKPSSPTLGQFLWFPFVTPAAVL